jgi:hypothetical protein
MMDPAVKAIYRTGCLQAAATMLGTWTFDGDVVRDEAIDRVVALAKDLYRGIVPESERTEAKVDLSPPKQHPEGADFLEESRRRAADSKAARDRDKMARAQAMADEDSATRTPNREPIDVT